VSPVRLRTPSSVTTTGTSAPRGPKRANFI
jgi:hypothetical protein